MVALNNSGTVEVLRNFGSLKYFKLSGMTQQIELFQFLVCAWDPTDQTFHIRDKMVSIIIEYIYSLTGLSRRGSPISLSGFSRGGESVRDYNKQFREAGTQPSKDGKINIRDVSDFVLRMILFMIAKLAGNVILNLVNISYMHYALECLEPKVINRSEVVLSLLKEKLTKVKSGKTKNFYYGSILIAFFLRENPIDATTTCITRCGWS